MAELFTRLTTKADMHLPSFDNTKLVAINTCPTWGLVRYEHHKTVSARGRAMALEAGDACHQAFAAIRISDLLTSGRDWFGSDWDEEFVHTHGRKLFNTELQPERYEELLEAFNSDTDPETRFINIALKALHTSGFYDDEDDKRRTVTNLERSLLAYVDRYHFGKRLPVYVPKRGILGVEIPFDITLEYDGVPKYRFIGRIDGISYRSKAQRNTFVIDENKTSGRLGDAWEQSFDMSHQVTGYMIAATSFLNEHGVCDVPVIVDKGYVYGLAIPQPKYANEFSGVVEVPVSRSAHQMAEWFSWFQHTVDLWETYRDKPLEAPHYTHSCNRFFRPCPLIPLCASDLDDRQDYWNTLVTDKWSPLEEGNE